RSGAGPLLWGSFGGASPSSVEPARWRALVAEVGADDPRPPGRGRILLKSGRRLQNASVIRGASRRQPPILERKYSPRGRRAVLGRVKRGGPSEAVFPRVLY